MNLAGAAAAAQILAANIARQEEINADLLEAARAMDKADRARTNQHQHYTRALALLRAAIAKAEGAK
jgi:hypothetical protein